MTEPRREALHEETLAYLEGHARQHRSIADMYGDIAEEGYAPKLRAEADKLAYAAECVRKRAELEAEVERLTSERNDALSQLNGVLDEARDRDAEVERLRREVEVLRWYGNKDCTAMADEALAAATRERRCGNGELAATCNRDDCGGDVCNSRPTPRTDE